MPKIVADETIYRAAMQMVIERGYAGATTKQIAQAADISEVTLFRKYGSKANLVKQAIMDMLARLDIGSAAHYTGDIQTDLRRVIETYQQAANESGQFFYVMLTEIPRYPELAGILNEPMGVMSQIAQLLARYQAEGVLQAEHPLQAMAALLGPIIIGNVIRGTSSDIPLPALNLENHVEFYLKGRMKAQ